MFFPFPKSRKHIRQQLRRSHSYGRRLRGIERLKIG